MGDVLAQAVELLGGAQVLDHPHSVESELVVEEPVADAHGEDDANGRRSGKSEATVEWLYLSTL